jgi:hypothetical protein
MQNIAENLTSACIAYSCEAFVGQAALPVKQSLILNYFACPLTIAPLPASRESP